MTKIISTFVALWQKTKLHTYATIADRSLQNGLANAPVVTSGIRLRR